MYGVTIAELIKKMNLKNMTPEIDPEKTVLTHPDVNRPALQLAGLIMRGYRSSDMWNTLISARWIRR